MWSRCRRLRRSESSGRQLVADLFGACLEEQRLLVVSDLHLEKVPVLRHGACCCRPMIRPQPWPAHCGHRAPRSGIVIALGDSFHDAAPPTGVPCRTVTPSRHCSAARLDLDFGQSRSCIAVDLGGIVASEVAIARSRFARADRCRREIADTFIPRRAWHAGAMDERAVLSATVSAPSWPFGAYTGA